jgi:hypothetical protein
MLLETNTCGLMAASYEILCFWYPISQRERRSAAGYAQNDLKTVGYRSPGPRLLLFTRILIRPERKRMLTGAKSDHSVSGQVH